MEAGGGRTAVRAVEAKVHFNQNTGEHFIVSAQPLEPLDVTIEEPDRRWELRGNELRVLIERCASDRDLTDLIGSLYNGLPILLNVELADPPVIERIEGKVGATRFRWELTDWQMSVHTITQEEQEGKVADSWERFELLSNPQNRRLIGALHYFHMACRLTRAGHSPWEFMAESILNLSKTLEVLFPPSGDGQTRDAARRGLAALGYSAEIERDFLPAMALRNEIDVGHVDLSLYTRQQLHSLHRHTEAAESAFREMLQRLMGQMTKGTITLDPYAATPAGTDAQRVIDTIEQYFGRSG